MRPAVNKTLGNKIRKNIHDVEHNTVKNTMSEYRIVIQTKCVFIVSRIQK